ncbi:MULTISPECIES: hypothetical protein [Gracilibacillus]|uniref:Uncharacterized protein n=1 Tax=Gracilibacillus dipsosauri TaxID=178340 RepID=A0A317KXI6_9BACI|nr:hypothetical protein [Gracilibacillus dipsosauri]PWU68231.1 hypothetical protein DLJ74_07170 [Gracilibacillus dipsosauri]
MNNGNQEWMKQFFDQYVKDFTHHEGNRSFVFLENHTLQMVMTYLFMHLENQPITQKKEDISTEDFEQLERLLDEMIEESNMAHKEMITILQEKLNTSS